MHHFVKRSSSLSAALVVFTIFSAALRAAYLRLQKYLVTRQDSNVRKLSYTSSVLSIQCLCNLCIHALQSRRDFSFICQSDLSVAAPFAELLSQPPFGGFSKHQRQPYVHEVTRQSLLCSLIPSCNSSLPDPMNDRILVWRQSSNVSLLVRSYPYSPQ